MRVALTQSPLRSTGRPVDVPVAIASWMGAWIVGQIVAVAFYAASGAETTDEIGIPYLFAGVAAGWIAYLVAMWLASRRSGSGDFVEDYALRFRPIDVVGVPIGVLSQLVLVPLVYVPLARLWPDTFSDDRLSENAEKLADRAGGATMVLLVLMVCVGAPIVEELVYRGLLQGSFTARFNHVLAWLAAAVWFTVIHFRPVEYPGLFAFALVVGACMLVTKRLGMSVATHVAFNVTGLLLAVR
ncbi:MAG: type II CAAX endopeptidase family protein [Ilumatobacteraceae bacterium]